MLRFPLGAALLIFGQLNTSLVFAQATTSLQDLGVLGGKDGNAIIYIARTFLTMDGKISRAEAVAVRDGRFIAVGKLADVQVAAGKEAKLDPTLEDKVVVAGFVEQHVHPVLAAPTMNTKVISIEDWDAIDGFSPALSGDRLLIRGLKHQYCIQANENK